MKRFLLSLVGEMSGVCEVLDLVSCFCCNGVVFSTKGLLSNFDEGEGPGVCGVRLLYLDAIK